MADIKEYTPPEKLAETDVDTIHTRMLSEIPSNIDQTEGGFVWDMTRPSAMEKSYAMEALNVVIQIMFPEWAEGDFLDLHARRSGISRKSAAAATGFVRVVGTSDVLIPKNFVFCTAATPISSSVEFVTTQAATLLLDPDSEEERYVADIPVACTEAGSFGNVPRDSIVLMSIPLYGITEVYNPEIMGGGAEEETDNELRQRIMEIDRTRETSYIGNNNDYKRWAMQVEGVGNATTIPEWMGKGTGTVKVLVMAADGGLAGQALLDKVYNYIMGEGENSDSRLAPVGAILTVATAIPMSIAITAQIVLEEGYTIETVSTAFRAALTAYFDEAKAETIDLQEGTILRYTRVGRALSETAGVVDYSELYINGARQNILVAIDDFPIVDDLTLTQAEVS